MNILLVFEYPTLLGGERSLLTVVGALQEANVHWRAIAPVAGPLAEALGARRIPVTPLPRFDRSDRQSRMRDFFATTLGQVRPNLIHANSLAMSRTVGPVALDLGIPAVGHLRDILRLSRQAIADLNSLNRMVAVSDAVRTHHVAQGIQQHRVKVIHNGVDLTQFTPGPPTGKLQESLGVPPHAPLIGGVGQLGVRKGWDVLLRALPDVFRQHPTAHFVLAGEQTSRKAEADAYVASLYDTASRDELAGRVHFLGHRNDVPELLREFTLLVHPARQEPLGRVLLEAGATGLPILATDVGGTPEIFPAGCEAAQLIPPDRHVPLAASIIRLLEDEALRQQLSRAARCRIESNFADKRCAEATWDLYQRVGGGSHRVLET